MKDWPEGMSRKDAELFRRGLKWLGREFGCPNFYRNLEARMNDDSLSPKQRHKLATQMATLERSIAIMAGRPYSEH